MYSLRMLYELRKTSPLKVRKSVARAVYHKGRVGLTDASGTLWPVYFRPNLAAPKDGVVVKFSVSAFRPDGAAASKYMDEGYLLVVDDIEECVEPQAPWPDSIELSPQLCIESLPEDYAGSSTRYFNSAISVRSALLRRRNTALQKCRAYFGSRNFLNMETPSLVPSGGVERYLKTFQARYKDFRNKEWLVELPTSPEFALKKLLAQGFGSVFQLARAFRNEGQLTRWHEPEFFMLEWYRLGGTLEDIIADTAGLVRDIASVVGSSLELPAVWRKYTVNELFISEVGIDLNLVQQVDAFREAAETLSPSIVASDDWDSIFCKLFMEKIEPRLQKERACFVTDYPMQMAALAKRNGQTSFAKRFEAYLDGIEICNGYQELTDSIELASRFQETSSQRGDLSRDKVFEAAMAFGLPPCSGNALGVDRVVAILLGLDGIKQLYPIPFLEQFPPGTVANE